MRHPGVVISTVGPFLKYGTPLVRACVENNTHYADITGESYWVSTIIDNFASLAVRFPSCPVLVVLRAPPRCNQGDRAIGIVPSPPSTRCCR